MCPKKFWDVSICKCIFCCVTVSVITSRVSIASVITSRVFGIREVSNITNSPSFWVTNIIWSSTSNRTLFIILIKFWTSTVDPKTRFCKMYKKSWEKYPLYVFIWFFWRVLVILSIRLFSLYQWKVSLHSLFFLMKSSVTFSKKDVDYINSKKYGEIHLIALYISRDLFVHEVELVYCHNYIKGKITLNKFIPSLVTKKTNFSLTQTRTSRSSITRKFSLKTVQTQR